MLNGLVFMDTKLVYRRCASLFFVCGVTVGDNELIALEIIHRYVDVLSQSVGWTTSDEVSTRVPLIVTLFPSPLAESTANGLT
jgi:hypothetical protein